MEQAQEEQWTVKQAIDAAVQVLNTQHPGPSRAKSLVLTKLDEARLWLSEIEKGG